MPAGNKVSSNLLAAWVEHWRGRGSACWRKLLHPKSEHDNTPNEINAVRDTAAAWDRQTNTVLLDKQILAARFTRQLLDSAHSLQCQTTISRLSLPCCRAGAESSHRNG